MPDVPAPEKLTPELDLIRQMAGRIPEPLRGVLTQERPIDFRPVDAGRSVRRGAARARAPRLVPARCRAAGRAHHASGGAGLRVGLRAAAHGADSARRVDRDRRLQLASLDHSLWMHRPFRADEWLLYAWTARSRRAPAASCAARSSRGTVSWWPRWRRKGSCGCAATRHETIGARLRTFARSWRQFLLDTSASRPVAFHRPQD